MSFSLDFIIPGKPVPKGRPRAAVIKGRAVMYTPKSTVSWEELVGSCARAALAEMRPAADMSNFKFDPDDILRLVVGIYVPRPKAILAKAIKSGTVHHQQLAPSGADPDNILKAVADGLQRCGLVPNDSRIASMSVDRFYSQSAENEYYTTVYLRRM